MPYRAPGSPGHPRPSFLTGKPIRYYRPKGSPAVRQLIDEGFQAFNAGRLSEACGIFSNKMLDAANDTTIGLTIAGAMTPAGLGGWWIGHVFSDRHLDRDWQFDLADIRVGWR